MRQRSRGRRSWTRWERIPAALLTRADPTVPKPAKKVRKKAEPSKLEAKLAEQIQIAGLRAPEREQQLVPGRKFRSDFVWRDARLVVEVEGGIFGAVRGRHATGAGMTRDAEKYNALALEGWTVLRVTPPQIRSGLALKWIEQALKKGQAA